MHKQTNAQTVTQKKNKINITNESCALDSVSKATVAMVASQSRSSVVWRSGSWRDIWTIVKDRDISKQFNTFHTYFNQRQSSYWPNIERVLLLKGDTEKGEKRRFERICLCECVCDTGKQFVLSDVSPHDYCANSQHISLTHCSQSFLLLSCFTETWLYLFPSLSLSPSFQSHLL